MQIFTLVFDLVIYNPITYNIDFTTTLTIVLV